MSNQPLTVWTGAVIEDWIDYNQHMSEGFYGLVFGMASDEYLLRIGFDEAYRETTKGAFYTVETHISFLDELALGTPLEVRTTVVGADQIRLHLFHQLVRGTDEAIAATQESLMLHVDTSVDRVGPMTDAVLAVAAADADAHRGLVDPDDIGKVIRGPQRADMTDDRWQFWIDRGGTFTDIVARRPDGSTVTHKLLSEHPRRYDDAAIQGIRDLLRGVRRPAAPDRSDLGGQDGHDRRHQRAARTGGRPHPVLVTTAGFGDALRIGYQARPDLFALDIVLPETLYEDVDRGRRTSAPPTGPSSPCTRSRRRSRRARARAQSRGHHRGRDRPGARLPLPRARTPARRDLPASSGSTRSRSATRSAR